MTECFGRIARFVIGIAGSEMPKKHPYKCLYCGRTIGAPIGHRCRGNMRYRRLRFLQEDGTIWKRAGATLSRPPVKRREQKP
jgi:hypothetical protein